MCANVVTANNLRLTVKHISIGFNEQEFGEGLSLDLLKDEVKSLRAQAPKEMTFDELNQITDQLTQFMRDKGFKFHYAYLPPQQPKNGVVKLQLVSVTLGDVDVRNNSDLRDSFVENQFKHLVGHPIHQPEIDALLKRLKTASGIQAFAYYSRGPTTNSMRLNVQLHQKQGPLFNLSADNYGSTRTGEQRLSYFSQWKNPLRRADKLSFAITGAGGEDTNASGFISYRMPLHSLAHHVSMGYSNNIFGIGEEFKDLELAGDAQTVRVGYDYTFRGSHVFDHKLALAYNNKENDMSSALDDPIFEADELAESWTLGWHGSFISPGRAQQSFGISVSQGTFSIEGQTDGDEEFQKSGAYYNVWLSTFDRSWAPLFGWNIRTQWSDDRLSSFERMILTGQSGVKGFESGSAASDSGTVTTAQLLFKDIFPKTLRQMDYFAFVDYAYGERYAPGGEVEDSGTLSSIGMGIDWAFHKHIGVRMSGATGIADDYVPEDTRSSRFYLRIYGSW